MKPNRCRAWNKHAKGYDRVAGADSKISIFDLDNGERCGYFGDIICGNDNFIKEWFIGLSDKNEKDIYEGDIIKTETGKNMVISWSKRYASFCIDRKGWAFVHWFSEAVDPEHVEIIGNIRENSELLK